MIHYNNSTRLLYRVEFNYCVCIYTLENQLYMEHFNKLLASQQLLTEICKVYSALKNYYTVHHVQKQIIRKHPENAETKYPRTKETLKPLLAKPMNYRNKLYNRARTFTVQLNISVQYFTTNKKLHLTSCNEQIMHNCTVMCNLTEKNKMH